MKVTEQFPEVANMALGLAKEHREGYPGWNRRERKVR